jgi:NADH dehydrogenase FAD-containing subunit
MTTSVPHVVIIGGSFAGLTAAYELKRRLRNRARVTVIDRNDQFVFIPSLILGALRLAIGETNLLSPPTIVSAL